MHRDEQEIGNLVIAVQDNGGNPLSEQDPTISTVTTTTTDESMVTTVASFGSSNNQSRQCFRKLSKQASTVHLERKTAKEEHDRIYKVAFNEATNLLAAAMARRVLSERVQGICNRLNAQ